MQGGERESEQKEQGTCEDGGKVAVKAKAPKKARKAHFLLRPAGKILLLLITLSVTIGLGVFTYYYVEVLAADRGEVGGGPFANTSMLFAAPRTVAVGDVASPQEIALELRHSGYNESKNNRMGYFTLKPEEIDIYPGPDSYFRRDDGVDQVRANKVSQIISLADNTERTEYTLEPELISNLFDKNREKRPVGEVRRHSRRCWCMRWYRPRTSDSFSTPDSIRCAS